MSAIVCGKRSFFEELPSSPNSSSPPVSKKLRFASSNSPVRLSPYSHSAALVDQLRAAFPNLDMEVLEKALEENGFDLDTTMKRLNELYLGHPEGMTGSFEESNDNADKGINYGDAAPVEGTPTQSNLPVSGAEWVELLVREMMGATSVDDAKCRAAGVLESLEKSITAHASTEALESLHKENMMLKGQIEVLLKDRNILKRAVAIQHERQKEYDDKNQEVQQLKQLVSQYQEQLRTLEVNNYALTMHLRQAQQSSSMPGCFNPDVF